LLNQYLIFNSLSLNTSSDFDQPFIRDCTVRPIIKRAVQSSKQEINMRKVTLALLFFVLCSLLVTACQSPTATPTSIAAPLPTSTMPSTEPGVITIATGEWTPFSGTELYENGFVLHVIREAFAREGIKVKYEFLPWERAYQAILGKDSTYLASAYWYRSSEREQECFYSEPINEEQMVFFFRKEKPLMNWNAYTDLAGYRIGTSLGITYPADFKQSLEQGPLEFEEAKDDISNFKKLLAGRIDLFPTTTIAGYELLRSNFTAAEVEQLDYNTKPLMTSTGHLLFAKNNPEAEKYLQLFNAGLEKLKSDGTYDQMAADLLAGKYSE
jgi:polar amino acid transport system substrate-binding protein